MTNGIQNNPHKGSGIVTCECKKNTAEMKNEKEDL